MTEYELLPKYHFYTILKPRLLFYIASVGGDTWLFGIGSGDLSY